MAICGFCFRSLPLFHGCDHCAAVKRGELQREPRSVRDARFEAVMARREKRLRELREVSHWGPS